MSDSGENKYLKPLHEAAEEIQNIMKKVLKLEHDRLHQKSPRINAEIIKIIKEEIK